jgi:hypothetical protein
MKRIREVRVSIFMKVRPKKNNSSKKRDGGGGER